MRKVLFSIIAVIIFTVNSNAQLSEGGIPKSLQLKKSTIDLPISYKSMPTIDIEALRSEDSYLDTVKGIPYRFGFNHHVSINPQNSGNWTNLGEDGKLWRVGIKSKGALSINLTFDTYLLPPGAKMFIYTEDYNEIIGAFTHINNQEDKQFATTLVKGESIIVEYYEPANVSFRGEINISKVTHAYRGVADYVRAFGQSGSCNMNVACPETAGWEDQIRSVGMMVTNGNGFCTGTLINNTNNDGTQYFLTADHCYSDPGAWVFWFNWQSETCSNPSSSPSYQSVSGATLRARNSASDFCLVEINQQIPENFAVYYSGWNRTTNTTINETITGIHHPSGDIKKFSYATGGVSTSGYSGNAGSTHWQISWSGGTTTEGGSSGSGLFDANHRLIGQLHGGAAACGNTQPDWYGKLGVSWTGGGSNTTRLSNWLDPNNSGVEFIDGYDPNATNLNIDAQLLAINSPQDAYNQVQQITPQVVIKNNGANNITNANLSYTLNGGTPVSTTWSGNIAAGETETVNFQAITLTEGNHTFIATVNVTGDEDANNNTLQKTFSVIDCSGSISDFPYNEIFNTAELPLCWSIDQSHSSNTWENTSGYSIGNTAINPQTGSNFYFVQWIAEDQDEWIISPSYNFSSIESPQISFWFNGSYSWSVDNNNCDLDLMVSVNGGNWTKIWDETNHQDFTSDDVTYQWLESEVDLSQYQGENDVRFAFRYTGNDGANFAIDNITLEGVFTGEYTLNIDINGEGSVSVNGTNYTQPISFEEGTNITIIATPSTDWNFDSWTGDLNSTQTNESFVMNSNKTISANFSQPTNCDNPISSFEYNENFNAPNLPECWEIDNTHSTNTWENTSGYTIGDIDINPISGANFYAVNWIAENQEEWIISPLFDFTNLETPEINFWFNGSYNWSVTNNNCDLDLMVSVNGGNWTKIWDETNHPEFTSDDVTYQWLETTIDLNQYEGQNNIRFAFKYTGNDGANFAIDDITIRGASIIEQYNLTINFVGNGTVNVNGNAYTQTISFDEGTNVSLQAIADNNWDFSNWTGDISSSNNPQSITMDDNKNITANFTEISPEQYTLTINIVGQGTVNVNGNAYSQSLSFDEGTNVSLQAIADNGYEFIDWTGSVTSVNNPENLSMNENKTIMANFEIISSIQNSFTNNLSIYPNPTKDFINIKSGNNIENFIIKNILGETILESNENSDFVNIDMSQFRNGLYFLLIKTELDTTIHKIKLVK